MLLQCHLSEEALGPRAQTYMSLWKTRGNGRMNILPLDTVCLIMNGNSETVILYNKSIDIVLFGAFLHFIQQMDNHVDALYY